MLKEYLPSSYKNGAADPIAREKEVHNAATIAGVAFANAFLGVCHSMAHKIGAEFHHHTVLLTHYLSQTTGTLLAER